MVYLSLGQAAKEVGLSKATISKALKTGRLSYVSKSTAGFQIDPAELFRVFTPKTLVTVESERSQTPVETGKSQADVFELQLLRERVEDLQRDRDAWREQAQRLALTGPEQQPKKGWRLFGQR
jgi:DNA-binding XRE family transcriptional regulator